MENQNGDCLAQSFGDSNGLLLGKQCPRWGKKFGPPNIYTATRPTV
ncbi:uncharacterized protein G2W53_002423 [Senna tora]|uniref:Uncharacterized protein n=1 Tax=Senna tora TaxID=362788 RepID=A0A834XLQ2_9FABA|nr:uncharacterized protein G2W53_002423 [Senna tora]